VVSARLHVATSSSRSCPLRATCRTGLRRRWRRRGRSARRLGCCRATAGTTLLIQARHRTARQTALAEHLPTTRTHTVTHASSNTSQLSQHVKQHSQSTCQPRVHTQSHTQAPSPLNYHSTSNSTRRAPANHAYTHSHTRDLHHRLSSFQTTSNSLTFPLGIAS